MARTLKEALALRRTIYALGNAAVTTDDEVKALLRHAADHIPSAFNSQTARMVLLLGKHHARLWQIVKDTLKARIPAEAFAGTETKIDNCFASGHGTILFFENQTGVQQLQQQFPTYAAAFPTFSEHTNAMHQLAVWTMLSDAGWGASLQHYNPLIDEAVRHEWQLPESWKLVAEMPFGSILQPAGDKVRIDAQEKVKVFE